MAGDEKLNEFEDIKVRERPVQILYFRPFIGFFYGISVP